MNAYRSTKVLLPWIKLHPVILTYKLLAVNMLIQGFAGRVCCRNRECQLCYFHAIFLGEHGFDHDLPLWMSHMRRGRKQLPQVILLTEYDLKVSQGAHAANLPSP